MINGILSQSAALYQTNRSVDGVQRAAGDIQGSGQPPEPELASGSQIGANLKETTVDPTAAGASTQVVEEASEALGLIIDTRA
ncbi:hypothetical protein ADIMK_0420 [Marinobacterium lacunae]|uniref:Uncharacterized protein n=1 Tax=Marinobacterium lacunae TaxID=1232683 RepID=A0A081G3V8_9GAMM|nr:hypothetical protein [Marinobacterium lacunae]KEA65463.1 hypothetical protein ADIMK_0420 [Marinobacterium lacunae]